MNNNKITFHCFFEQSGTFKNVFKRQGHNAFDYDLYNHYNETDYKINLFKEIEKEYDKISNANITQNEVLTKIELKYKDKSISSGSSTFYKS